MRALDRSDSRVRPSSHVYDADAQGSHYVATLTAAMTDLDSILLRIREEFREMPGLQLTPAQATRLWGLEIATCQTAIDALVASAFLRWTPAGAVTRTEA
jgi:hypothetical protein